MVIKTTHNSYINVADIKHIKDYGNEYRVYIDDGYYYELSKKNIGHDHFPKKKLVKLWLEELRQSDSLVTAENTKLEGELPSSAHNFKEKDDLSELTSPKPISVSTEKPMKHESCYYCTKCSEFHDKCKC